MGEKNKKKKRKKWKKEKKEEKEKQKTKKEKKPKFFPLPSKTMGCFSGCLMSAASDQNLFCKLCSPFCCSFNEFVEEKVITPSYSSAILTSSSSFIYPLSSALSSVSSVFITTPSFEPSWMNLVSCWNPNRYIGKSGIHRRGN